MVQSICIIGAGAAGLAALKAISDSQQYKSGLWQPTAFEAREQIGGVWVSGLPPVTPLYDSLTTNLPHPVMAYSSFSFPPSTYLYPRAKIVEDYLDAYAEHFNLKRHIQLNTKVLSVTRAKAGWKVSISSQSDPLDFDLVIVCNGHYGKPRYPATSGLQNWLEQGKASHSLWYRSPGEFSNLAILVVGAGPSGQDITAETQLTASRVIHSINGASFSQTGKVTTRPRVARFGPGGRVEFEDGSVEEGIDHAILATGYEMSFPFLPDSLLRLEDPPPPTNLPDVLHNSSYNVYPLAKHVFPSFQSQYPPHTLVFLGLPSRVAPLPLLEAQAHAAVRYFSEPASLDIVAEKKAIEDRYSRLSRELGTTDSHIIWKDWHKIPEYQQFDYRDDLYRFASSAPNPSTHLILSQDWEKEIYGQKVALRKLWVDLEKSGKADDFVRGVGEKGDYEWIELMRRLLAMAEDKGVENEAPGPAS